MSYLLCQASFQQLGSYMLLQQFISNSSPHSGPHWTFSNMRSWRTCLTVCCPQAEELRKLNHEPYAYRFDRTHTAAQLQAQYTDLPAGQLDDAGASVSIAGRVTAKRFMGKLAFATLVDDSGSIQLYLEKQELDGKAADAFK
jgi:lysyl-tRNA synthetase class II